MSVGCMFRSGVRQVSAYLVMEDAIFDEARAAGCIMLLVCLVDDGAQLVGIRDEWPYAIRGIASCI